MPGRKITSHRHLSALSKKMRSRELVLSLLILLCSLALMLKCMTRYEGFTAKDRESRYNALRKRLVTDMAEYCKLTDFAQAQMKTMFTASGGGSESDAVQYIKQTYVKVYACADELADSRAPCTKVSGEFLPCTTYTKLPEWSNKDEESIAIALSAIPNTLPIRIKAESEYYKSIIAKLQTGVSAAKNPPSAPPNSPSTPAKSPSGKPWSLEGFESTQCSPEAAKALRERIRLDAINKESKSCTIPSADSEITRINAMLESKSMKTALSESNTILSAMIQLQADMEEIKKRWGDDGPKKTYARFQGGDRAKAFLFSIQQNL